MEKKMIAEKLNKIEMPKEMRERVIKNCVIEMEEKTMRKNTSKKFLGRPVVAVASLVLCLCLTGVTALAATGKLQGFFKDITDWKGAVTGTAYEQATDEVELSVALVADELAVAVTMLKPEEAPYSSFETFGIESYKIVDLAGSVIAEGEATALAEVVDGKVNVNISLDNISSGEYKLIVNKMVGSAKADQPLVISGTWECEFAK